MNDPARSPNNLDPNLTGSVGDDPAPATDLRPSKSFAFCRKYWWLPILTAAISLGAAAVCVWQMEPTFTSQASIWEAIKVRLPGSELFSQDEQSDLGTQTQVILSERIKQLALTRLRTLITNGIPRDPEGNPLAVKLTVKQEPKSSVVLIGASGSNPAWTRAYLDSVINVYLEFRKNVRREVSGDTLASISEEVSRLERELQVAQDNLLVFEQSNNLSIVREEATSAGSYLVKLQAQLSDCQLEAELLDAGLAPELIELGWTNSSSRSQAETAHHQTLQLKMEHIRKSIKEWTAIAVSASANVAEADRLRMKVARTQSIYDRFVDLLRNIDISRNIDQATFADLEPASEAKRIHAREHHILRLGGFGGLGLGCGIIVLVELYRAIRRNPPKAKAQLGQEAITPNAVERLKQLKELREKGLLSEEAYRRKMERIIDSL